jgi:hypothetical protein
LIRSAHSIWLSEPVICRPANARPARRRKLALRLTASDTFRNRHLYLALVTVNGAWS